MVLYPSETTRCLHVSPLGKVSDSVGVRCRSLDGDQGNLESVRRALEQFGEIEIIRECPGHRYGFASFKSAEDASRACREWRVRGVRGVSVNPARRENPISRSASDKKPSHVCHKRKRKRRKLGVGEPVAWWANTQSDPHNSSSPDHRE